MNVEKILLSKPLNFREDYPLTPERVKFEAFNEDHWGWVLKHLSDENGSESTRAEILIPEANEIKEAAIFTSAENNTKAVQRRFGSCESANTQYQEWKKRAAPPASPETADKAKNEEVLQKPIDSEPALCTKYTISYRTDQVVSKFFTPLYLTLSGMKDGEEIEQKHWKVMFDQKSMSYLLPKELLSEDE